MHPPEQAEHEPPAGDRRPDEALTFADVLSILRRRAWILVLIPVIAVGIALPYSLTRTPMYESSSLVVIQKEAPDDPASPEQGIQFEVEGLKALTPTMATAATSRPVVNEAIRRAGLRVSPEEVAGRLTAEPVADTLFVRLGYSDASPERAQQIVSAVSAVFTTEASNLDPLGTRITPAVWETANLPNSPVSPNHVVNVSLALAAGVVTGLLGAFLVEALANAGVFGRRALDDDVTAATTPPAGEEGTETAGARRPELVEPRLLVERRSGGGVPQP